MSKRKADREGTSYEGTSYIKYLIENVFNGGLIGTVKKPFHEIVSLHSHNPLHDIDTIIKLIPNSDSFVNWNRSTAIKGNDEGTSYDNPLHDIADYYASYIKHLESSKYALIDDETTVSSPLESVQENYITDWGTIQTLSDLKKANIRAVPSRLQCMRTNKAAKRMKHVITGQELIERIGQPEYFSKIQLGNYLCLSKGDNSRKEMGRLMDLVPKEEKTQMTAITSAWSHLTKGDVQYQKSSLAELSKTCLDREKIAQNVYNKMTGDRTEKEAAVDHTKQVMELLMNEINNTSINTAMHGELLQAVWDVFESLLPKASK